MIKKQLGEKKVYFIFHFAVPSSFREFKAITGAHVMEVFCLLDHPPWLTQPASLYTETTFLGVPKMLGPSTSIDQENALKTCL